MQIAIKTQETTHEKWVHFLIVGIHLTMLCLSGVYLLYSLVGGAFTITQLLLVLIFLGTLYSYRQYLSFVKQRWELVQVAKVVQDVDNQREIAERTASVLMRALDRIDKRILRQHGVHVQIRKERSIH